MLYKCKFFKLCPWLQVQDEADKQRTQEQALIQKNNLKERRNKSRSLDPFQKKSVIKEETKSRGRKGQITN